MRENLKPIVTLMLLDPLLTELLTGNIPLNAFNPIIYLFLATIGYGFPILLLREFGVRRGAGLLGMLPLGLCYGIYNEGFLAKTFFLTTGVPINTFDRYGFFGGVEVPWAVTISVWHGFFAFLFPILLVETIFPDFRGKPWLSRKGALAILIPTVLLAVLIFFGRQAVPPREAGDFLHFAEIWLVFVALVVVAMKLPSRPSLTEQSELKTRNVLFGVGIFLAVILIPFIFAGAKMPPALFLGYYVSLFGLAWLQLSQRSRMGQSSLVQLALGAYIAQALFGLLIGVQMRSPVMIATEAAFVTAFILGMSRLETQAKAKASS